MKTWRIQTLAVILGISWLAAPISHAADVKNVVRTYADIAHAMYADALDEAKHLDKAIKQMISHPTQAKLDAARSAWVMARIPYQQTEGLRFGNAIVDDWEGKVNAWPLDEGLLDYVDTGSYGKMSDENPAYTLNLVANTKIMLGNKTVDATTINKALLAETLHEALDVEANVATGYHAIEFLLWGQDLNGTGPGGGSRPVTDYARDNCTNGNCDRRAQLLTVLSDLLLDDLKEMMAAWDKGGSARSAIMNKSDSEALSTILTGLGSLSYGELAGERIKLGLLLHDPEEEHDCFADNTHNSHYYNQVGMIALYTGQYVRTDGSVVSGRSLADFAASKAPAEKAALDKLMQAALAKMQRMKDMADSGQMAYDQMIGEGNDRGNQLITEVVNSLVAQTRGIEKVVAKLGLTISIEGSDSLDNPKKVM